MDSEILDDTSSLSNNETSSCSSLTLDSNLETKHILIRTIRSFSLLLCTCLFISNWLCLGLIYFFPKISSNYCLIQSFFLHIFTIFHLHLTICLRLLWHFYFTFEKSWEKITYERILYLLGFIFICLCLFTLPSLSNEWASITYDKILQICIVNYTFNYSYTFFVLTFTCLIPFIILILSHIRHMQSIEHRISKTFSSDENLNLLQEKIRFQCSSYLILIWSFCQILLLICLHIPIKHTQIRMIIYYIQLISYLLDPILYIFIFRSLSIIILLRSTIENYFV